MNQSRRVKQSIWQKLDPRSKLLLLLTIIMLVIKTDSWVLVLLSLLLFLLIHTSHLAVGFFAKVFLKFRWLILIIFMVNCCFNIALIDLTTKIGKAGMVAYKVYLLLLVAYWFNFVTTPFELINGIEHLLKPLSKLKLPVFDLTMHLTLVVKFIPEIIEIADNIIMAQRIRGVNPHNNWRRSMNWIKSTIIPVFIVGMRKTSQTAMVLEARGYRPGVPRTTIKVLKFTKMDYAIVFASLLSLLVILC
ncbi:MAG TPA: energy-coupling factor transporter transmembrane component T [Bacillota bacterium]|jgi:energy-coupling factor transport system permease protein|nr:energy-coupling factor transporter transmembrane component T [Bacillota bacterium]HPO96451.1 energy-coupling factor transporter transmembrane component T [Bacillota bacterium]